MRLHMTENQTGERKQPQVSAAYSSAWRRYSERLRASLGRLQRMYMITMMSRATAACEVFRLLVFICTQHN